MSRILPKDHRVFRLASAAGRKAAAWQKRLQKIFVFALVIRVMHELSSDDATHMAAGVAYYALFSLFPLLLGVTILLSFFVTPATIESSLTTFAQDYLPGAEDLLTTNLEAIIDLRGGLSVFAFLGALWSGSAVFGAITKAVNRAWDIHRDRPLFLSKPRQLAMAGGVGLLFLLSFSMSTFARVTEGIEPPDIAGGDFLFETFGRVVLRAASLLITVTIFVLIYKLMPNCKTYWRYVWPGAIVAAVLFELGKNLFIVYVDRFANFESAYGSVAPVIGLLLWTYVSSFILILGAEISSEYGRLKRGVNRGVPIDTAEKATGRQGPG